MFFLVLAVGYLISAITALLLTPLLRRLAYQKGWVDEPKDNRRMHTLPVPRIGGVAIMGGFAAGIVYFVLMQHVVGSDLLPPSAYYLLLGALIIGATGFYDDVHDLGFKRKFAVQVAVAFVVVWGGCRIDLTALPFLKGDVYQEALVSHTLTLLWIVGITNAVNLIDGLDGLAAGIAVIAFASLAVAFGFQSETSSIGLMIAVVGGTIGFLIYNYHPATIFMGDSGSMFLGFLLAVYSIEGNASPEPTLALIVPFLALSLPLIDTSMSIMRRMVTGRSPFAPDRDHIHHRVVEQVQSHRQAVLILYAISSAFGICAVLLALPPLPKGGILLSVMAMLVHLLLVYLLLKALGYVDVAAALHWRPRQRVHQQPVAPMVALEEDKPRLTNSAPEDRGVPA